VKYTLLEPEQDQTAESKHPEIEEVAIGAGGLAHQPQQVPDTRAHGTKESQNIASLFEPDTL